MITKEELNPHCYGLTDEQEKNQKELLIRINKLRAAWGKPMIGTSGVRSAEEHVNIYRKKAEKAGQVFDITKVPMLSKHLFGAAWDVSDPKGELYAFCQKDKEKALEDADLWVEKDTKGWVHFQMLPYGSYKKGKSRFFKP